VGPDASCGFGTADEACSAIAPDKQANNKSQAKPMRTDALPVLFVD
jgi:hypothetical protein